MQSAAFEQSQEIPAGSRLACTAIAARSLFGVRTQAAAKSFQRRRGGQIECQEQTLGFRQDQSALAQRKAVVVDERYRFFGGQIEGRRQDGRAVVQRYPEEREAQLRQWREV